MAFIVKSNLKGIHVFINNSSLKGELNDSISSITSSTHQTEIGVEDLKNNTSTTITIPSISSEALTTNDAKIIDLNGRDRILHFLEISVLRLCLLMYSLRLTDI